ncbi:hypothetical protein COE50_27450 [Bacillus anthracis]|nr:hypothetical protein COE50_27450 [Bacillus anthracis]
MVRKIEDIYQEILNGNRKRFPVSTWKEDKDGRLKKRVTTHLIESVLKWNDEEIREKWGQDIIIKSRLTSVLMAYGNSPYEMLNAAYPNRFEAWELKRTPKRFWTYEKSLKILKKMIEEKEQLEDYELLEVYSLEWLIKNNLGGPCSMYFSDSPFKMLNAAYPNKFKEWQLKNVPKNFWTKEKSFEALYWWIEEKEQLTKENLLDVFSREWLKERNLGTPITKFWNNNAYKMLNAAYPNQFREWELKRVSHSFWVNQEKSLKIFKQIIKEKGFSKEDIKKYYSLKWIVNNGLRTPLRKFWSDSPYKMLNAAYPGCFKEWELNEAPNGFWEKERAKEIIKDEMEKAGVGVSQLLIVGGRKWMIKRKLRTPFNKYWGGSTRTMLRELFPKEFEQENPRLKP